MSDFITQPWPWYIAGPLIGLMIPALLLLGNKQFGISSTLRHLCAAYIPNKVEYFRYDWKSGAWSLMLALGVMLGGWLGTNTLGNSENISISPSTISDLQELGIKDFSSILPVEVFNWQNVLSVNGIVFLVLGGFLVGFGTRYANGCTSGHAIMGLSLLSIGSLAAVIGFFIGGLLMTHLILPLIL